MVHLVGARVLAGDVVDYIAFRAVCSGWRACTPTTRDPTLRSTHLRPLGWNVALCDGDAVRPDDACEITFFHTRTARRLRVGLPELRRHRIVGFTDGLVVLLHKRTTAVRVLHPFTRVAVDFPPLASVYREVVQNRHSMLDMNAAVCSAPAASIAVVVCFPWLPVVLSAEAGRPSWDVLHRGHYVGSTLPFHGSLYATRGLRKRVVQLYPRPLNHMVAHAPHEYGDPGLHEEALVESRGRMLLVIRHLADQGHAAELWQQFAVDLSRGKLIPVRSLGDRTLFLSSDRCLSVSARDLPSLSGNSIYFSLPLDPVVMHSLRTGLSERLAVFCQVHDRKDMIRASVRPFTIADHLLTYCNPREWTKGLMFHEYYYIPESFEELWKKIKKQNLQLRIPRSERRVQRLARAKCVALKEEIPPSALHAAQ